MPAIVLGREIFEARLPSPLAFTSYPTTPYSRHPFPLHSHPTRLSKLHPLLLQSYSTPFRTPTSLSPFLSDSSFCRPPIF